MFSRIFYVLNLRNFPREIVVDKQWICILKKELLAQIEIDNISFDFSVPTCFFPTDFPLTRLFEDYEMSDHDYALILSSSAQVPVVYQFNDSSTPPF